MFDALETPKLRLMVEVRDQSVRHILLKGHQTCTWPRTCLYDDTDNIVSEILRKQYKKKIS